MPEMWPPSPITRILDASLMVPGNPGAKISRRA
jgi:hypothetical protein